MDLCLSTAVCHLSSGCRMLIRRTDLQKDSLTSSVLCSASKKRGFGNDTTKKEKSKNAKNLKESSHSTSETRNSASGELKTRSQKAPQLTSGTSRNSSNAVLDQQFLEKVEAVRRSALEQKKAEENKNYQAIDYDPSIEPEQNTIGLGTKVGVGAAVLVFGLVFAFGDFLPYGSVSPSEDASTIGKTLTEEEKSTFKTKLEEYKEILSKSPEDPTALEGAVVTMEELGDYEQASSLLEKLTKERPNNADVYRLLGDVKFELKDYDGSASAYKNSLSASGIIDFEVLRGLTNSLLAAKKPGTAVQELLKYREQLNEKYLRSSNVSVDGKVNLDKENLNADPIQVDLLLGKAYSDWGRVSDAVVVYDQLISKHPDDFRGYLAKGIILKENGSVGDAERMFIQARFFAPEKVKALVDRYSGK
ncbi:unnamed protein product [Musa acuminata subsp. malaccensis]|uniref:(wild Malaysian banana) hypothetical protein n=1 Tax=Musa acuminata subsp. malaccensis TaxID=214687 RepID=A0A804KD86_MUSAM|nr:PREDICTED: uncharacterized protein LOC103995732 isoform X1 [Musa acuminata subsp. malaccensis]CAG1833389.1 unnamed protein product [Musa acuminata subsp. malaccensis]